MSENREPGGCQGLCFHDGRPHCLLPRDLDTRCPLRRPALCGVKSTGIYCRPVCPARTPKFENAVFAVRRGGTGGRLSPMPALPPGDFARSRVLARDIEHVSRALALIEAGGSMGPVSKRLAERLGVGARQLRRLFHQHLGASPDRRGADAAGAPCEAIDPRDPAADDRGRDGGRLRQRSPLQRNSFRSCSDVRRRVAAGPRPRQAGSGRVVAPSRYRPPYDWDAMLSFLRQRAIPGVEAVSGTTLPPHG